MSPPRPPLTEEQIRAVERRAWNLRDWRPRADNLVERLDGGPRRCPYCGDVSGRYRCLCRC